MKILMHCKSLQILLLAHSFNGEGMPSDDDMVSFDGFRNLRFLSLAHCDLTSRIPVWLAKLKSLEILALDGNKITGTIPSWLGTDLPRLFNIGLSMNLISGEFPKELCRLPALVHELIAAQADQYELELPIYITKNSGVLVSHGLRSILYGFPSWIDLSSNNITGNIPSEIGQLQLLQELYLYDNNFSGNIPDQMSNLKMLEVLDLSENHLSGKIPSSLASLNFLAIFNVSYNNLEGPIPTSTQLQSFEASAFEGNPKLCGAPLPNECRIDAHDKNNQDDEDDGHQLPWFYIFTVFGFIFGFWGVCGKLPLSLTSGNIQTPDLSSNYFHGPIPSSFFMLAWNLTSFNVSNNAFSSYIPSSICLHSNHLIRVLDFSSNQFSGNILPSFGRCSELQIFRAGHNNLSGLLPEDIYNATKLEEIAVHMNSLYGGISERIVNLSSLAILDLSFNQLSGVLPLYLGKLSRLKIITLDFNDLQGLLPQSLMNCTSLVELRLGRNNLEGDITKLNFSKLVQLTKLDLYRNNFTGKLPTSLYSCRSLKAVRLASNNLEGQIQPEILSLNSLSFLSLTELRLENVTRAMKILMHCKSLQILLMDTFNGEGMPSNDDMVGFDGFRNLRILSLPFCDLTGRLPVWLAKLKSLEILDLAGNKITGSIPSWLGTDLPRLFSINLAMNLISGEFPKELCRIPVLVHEPIAAQADQYELELPMYIMNNGRLSLDNNNFSGNIPNQMSNLKKLEILNLSKNHLSGKIPSSLASLNFLNSFVVSYNNLEGPIPISTQLQSFEALAFEGNPKLCGAPLPNECRTYAHGKNNRDDEDDGHQLPWFYISAVFGFIFGFWGVCGSLIVKKTWRYAYFQFTDNVQDRLYVMLAVRLNRMKRWLS
ncbi:receptor-like protein 2 [Pyrus x bretschneideri]|uniref:receptor-like protein 2 n=1 Tax=Pyrus x bretschneideri TaxID=225117 RepID=UPI00202E0200|nr:receptor-like protein 2 [Pyrus x bretschneideri]